MNFLLRSKKFFFYFNLYFLVRRKCRKALPPWAVSWFLFLVVFSFGGLFARVLVVVHCSAVINNSDKKEIVVVGGTVVRCSSSVACLVCGAGFGSTVLQVHWCTLTGRLDGESLSFMFFF